MAGIRGFSGEDNNILILRAEVHVKKYKPVINKINSHYRCIICAAELGSSQIDKKLSAIFHVE